MKNAPILITDDNAPKKLAVFLEKLMAESLWEKIQKESLDKVDKPYE